MVVCDRQGMCWFWTTDDWALGYCRFDGSECHASTADDYGARCEKFRALVKLSNKFKIPLTELMFYPEGKNVHAQVIPEFVEDLEDL